VKILFSTRPSFGHVYPLMPLAFAARDAGHDVTFATTGPFVEQLRRLGFVVHEVGVTIESARDELVAALASASMPRSEDGRPDLSQGARLFIDGVARPTAADLTSLLPAIAPDVVVYEQYELGAAVAGHAAGIPVVCHSLSPQMPEGILSGEGALDRLARLWSDYGVLEPSLDVLIGDAYLDIFPSVMQPPAVIADPARIRLRPIPFVEPGATLPRWVGRSGRRLIYLTLGTVVATDEVLVPAINGLAGLDADVLVALGSAAGAELGALPANVHIEAFVDQPAVLRHADLAVHHGGSGTALAALAAGTPQLLLPKGADQFINADIMTATGLAAAIEPPAISKRSVADAAAAEIGRLRPAAFTTRAELLNMPDPSEVVTQLVARFGPHRSETAA
jgi:UDP:flavonoid glycosyltransferase YjiC (YdhE family)